ncbi:hypothetical protein LZ318_11785 [Saccharopolyspora indica]|uniref:hypothetical protein n=1 Tax=Saccharopolyspora indica TaxID=1229659 RepID=UPI0022EAC7D1|nr:hypothetical protein [Saccharopolyspora indica]MDA3643808.1 hypothetical protein [Saccharopolyspora indica]
MANTQNPVITYEEIKAWIRQINPETGKKYTYADIGAMYGVTRQYISLIVRRNEKDRPKTAREKVREHFPWRVSKEFIENAPCKRLRDHAEYMETYGEGMSREKLERLLWFYRKLKDEDVVVEYDPEIPPNPGEVITGGFAYRKRLPSDGKLIIRVNKHTHLTPEGETLWRMPKHMPDLDRAAD